MKQTKEFKTAASALAVSIIENEPGYLIGRDEISRAAIKVYDMLISADFDRVGKIIADQLPEENASNIERQDALYLMQQLNDVRKMYRSENGRQ